MATRTVPHGQAFCPIGNRSVHEGDRHAGASCPYCGIYLPKKNGTVLVVVEDDGTVVSSEHVPEPSLWKRAGPILVMCLFGILIILVVASVIGDHSDSGSARFNGIVLDCEPRNPASIHVEFRG